jgi:hypothetical protein
LFCWYGVIVDHYFTYFVPVFKYCYSDSRNIWTAMNKRTKSANNGNLWKRNNPDLVQAFLKKWWVESDFKAPNLPLSLRLATLTPVWFLPTPLVTPMWVLPTSQVTPASVFPTPLVTPAHTTGTPEFTLGVKLCGFPDCFTLGVPDEGYTSNVSSALYKNHFRLKKVL